MCRAGQKLEAALAAFGVDPTGLVCLDSGVSTGGFTDCLLQHGAAHVSEVAKALYDVLHIGGIRELTVIMQAASLLTQVDLRAWARACRPEASRTACCMHM